MWLIDTATLQLKYFVTCPSGKYAILSHRWEDDELDFVTFRSGQGRHAAGFKKIRFCCQQAQDDGLEFAWVDTCCIDKTSSAELSEAINSMYEWYEKAGACYAYLSDVQIDNHSSDPCIVTGSKWFTRGWTLQELLAPQHINFFDQSWSPLGTRQDHARSIHDRFGIAVEILQRHQTQPAQRTLVSKYSVAERMTWASHRETTREEDIAYCLLGLFQVNIPLLYGEGSNAFRRLQEAIIQKYDDESIFTWTQVPDQGSSMLARSPLHFTRAQQLSNNMFKSTKKLPKPEYTLTNKGLRFQRILVPYRPGVYVMPLYCMRVHSGRAENVHEQSRMHDLQNQFNDNHECTEFGIFLYQISNDQYCRIRYRQSDYASLDGNSLDADWYSLPTWRTFSQAAKFNTRIIYICDPPSLQGDLHSSRVTFEFRWVSTTSQPDFSPLIWQRKVKVPQCHKASQFIRSKLSRPPFPDDRSSEPSTLAFKEFRQPVRFGRTVEFDFADLHDMAEGLNFSFTGTRRLRQIRIGFDQDFKPICRMLLARYLSLRHFSSDAQIWQTVSVWHAKVDEKYGKREDEGSFKPEVVDNRTPQGFWIAKGVANGLFMAHHFVQDDFFPFYRTKITVYLHTYLSENNNDRKIVCEVTEERLLPSSDGEEWQARDYRSCVGRSLHMAFLWLLYSCFYMVFHWYVLSKIWSLAFPHVVNLLRGPVHFLLHLFEYGIMYLGALWVFACVVRWYRGSDSS